MKKFLLLLGILLPFFSCKNDDLPSEKNINQACLESSIPCPEIIGEKNEGCVANIIFIAEGFTESEIPEFEALSDMGRSAILEMEPFKSAEDDLNFYRVSSPSETSGIRSIEFTSPCTGTTGINTTSDTPWEVFSNKVGLKRLLGMELEKRDSLEVLFGDYATGDYVYTIIIANTKVYSGGSEFPGVAEYDSIEDPRVSNMIVAKHDSGTYFKYLIRHEFGHSFGNLDDEYVDQESKCAMEQQQGFFMEEPKLNVLTYNPGSWYEGARYVPTGYWREWENSIMRTDYYAIEFSPVQRKIVEDRLEDAIGCR